MYEFNLSYYTIRLLKYKSDTYDNFIYHMAIDDSTLKIPIIRLKFSDKTAYIIANTIKSKCDNLDIDNNDIEPTQSKISISSIKLERYTKLDYNNYLTIYRINDVISIDIHYDGNSIYIPNITTSEIRSFYNALLDEYDYCLVD